MLYFLIVLSLFLILAVSFFFLPSTGHLVSRREMSEYAERTPYTNGEVFTYPESWKLHLAEENNTSSVEENRPAIPLPVSSPDFSGGLPATVTWLGHSSVLISVDGRSILVDPVFSERCSPFRYVGPKRFTPSPATASDLPFLDIVLLTHDHYDHLDLATVRALSGKTSCFIVPLGLERHLIRWGISPDRIKVLSWWESTEHRGLRFSCCPARHFSGRHLFDANRTLFCSWMIQAPSFRLFVSGDGSYGRHFREISARYGTPDLAVMECGQFDPHWHPSHMYPEESVSAALDLGASFALPVHWGTFPLAPHPWNDPVIRFTRQAEKDGLKVITPLIGETADLSHPECYAVHWWTKVQ